MWKIQSILAFATVGLAFAALFGLEGVVSDSLCISIFMLILGGGLSIPSLVSLKLRRAWSPLFGFDVYPGYYSFFFYTQTYGGLIISAVLILLALLNAAGVVDVAAFIERINAARRH